MWQKKTIDNLTANEFYQILKLRIDTFVVEQNRIYHELDDNDTKAIHIFYQEDEKSPVLAYARVFQNGKDITFGRVVTRPEARGTGLGNQLMTQILAICQENWPTQAIEIESQKQVVGFYEKFGFTSIGQPFTFEGTPHVTMRHEVK
ncbi:GNAT family N-acetyltransferase [Fructobacillus americanaquae]|uniref:GNAT family N-acetyltransferase n=1 Tax=Fructobacillus americanaquae TaxID=2940302 RepID=A0ABY5C189_9LACO|nr:GNAT family N-acetyltransferase [Fructobacillus americanaquae]USS92246.1 GNAT family N-acetyltransferase [Fructobacillus americanaquae]